MMRYWMALEVEYRRTGLLVSTTVLATKKYCRWADSQNGGRGHQADEREDQTNNGANHQPFHHLRDHRLLD